MEDCVVDKTMNYERLGCLSIKPAVSTNQLHDI